MPKVTQANSDKTNIETAIDKRKVDIVADNFICPNCGATMSFDIKKQKFMCPACKTEGDINAMSETVKEYDFSKYHEREKNSVSFDGIAVVKCGNCGAEITFSEYQISSVCPMCSSAQIASVKQRAGIMPEGIVPFKIDKQGAQQKFRAWAKSRWFAPNDFKKLFGEGGLKGMYLPFWTYDANAVSQYSGLGGRNRIVRDSKGNTTIKTDWYPVSGVVQNSFDDVLVCASDKEKMIEGILPYRTTSQTVPFSNAYLSGYYAELYKIKADSGFEYAKSIMEHRMKMLAEMQIRSRYDQAMVQHISTRYGNVTYKHILLPLWASVFGYKGKKYGYLINGETGAVTGQRPYSKPKIIAAVVAAVLLFMLIYAFISGGESYNEYSYDNAINTSNASVQMEQYILTESLSTSWYNYVYEEEII